MDQQDLTQSPERSGATPEDNGAKERSRRRLKAALGLLAVTIIIALLIWIFWGPIKAFSLEMYAMISDRETFRQRIQSFGVWAPLIFILFQVFQVLVSPIPGELVGAAGGYTFGWLPALIYSSVGLTIGSWMNFFIARLLGKSFVEKMVPPEYLAKIAQIMERQGVIAAFIFFTIPGLPKDYFCYALGLTPMSWRIFLVVSCAGRIPGTLLLSIQGALVYHQQYWSFFLLVVLSIVFIAPVLIWREKIYRMLYRLEKGRGVLSNGKDC